MRKYWYIVIIIVGLGGVFQIANAETSVLPPASIKNVRTDINLVNNNEVKLNNLNLLWHGLSTIVDNDKNLYFCLDEGKYYPSGNEYQVDLNQKIPGSVLWLMETFYQNQGKNQEIPNVPNYRDANELTRYSAIQLAIWKLSGGTFDDKIVNSNPLISDLCKEAAKQPSEDLSYQDLINKINNVKINAKGFNPDGEDGEYNIYKLEFEDNLDQETEKLFQIRNEDTSMDIELSKNGKKENITDNVTIEKDLNNRVIFIGVPKNLIDEENSINTTIYCSIASKLVTRQPYYLVCVTGGFYQSLGAYQTIERDLTTEISVDLDSSETTFSVLKHWDDLNNQDGVRPVELPVQLYQSNKPYQYTENESVTDGNEISFGDKQLLSEKNGWEYKWKNLPMNDSQGNRLYYTAREELDSEYTLSIQSTNDGTVLSMTNKYIPETTELCGSKIWDDQNNQDGLRPDSIEVQLLANGETVQTKTVTEQDDWAYQFLDLPKNKDGRPINYTILETPVSEYTVSIDGNNLINKHIPEETEIKGAKQWEDNNNQDGKRPESITVNLLADGEVISSKEVSSKDEWIYQFTNLPKYKDGSEIHYTVTENTIPNYVTSIDGFNLKNSYTPEETEIKGTKQWEDNNNQDGKRPESITVNLLADGEVVSSKEVSSKDEWTYQFTNLPKYRDGSEIHYTVTENTVPNYVTSIDGFNLKNSYTPEETEIKGMKQWDDNNNQDGKRPESITVNLLANGQVVSTKEISSKDGWVYQFTNLPKYKNGNEICYTVTENAVANYTTSIEGFDLKNSYTPGKTSVTTTKAWVDGDDQEGLRPQNIKVQLYANGKAYGKAVELSEDNKWTTTWMNLDEKDAGKMITYTVKELNVPDEYEVTYDDAEKGNIIITNTHDPKNNSVVGDNNSSDQPTNGIKTQQNYPSTGEAKQPFLYIAGCLVVLGTIYLWHKKY
ncbi:Cna B-type domain-containing protein [Candidatus Enterococcus ferrettii]|uniref:Collagen adhesin n=1 Tax=Candidatus Enterococcus ferrettii TaxID=2815324 RepID=A0ABV0ES37_9ENTE|nr:Cna B-type domain-containing protein [Enterococcus sp. 665A]MBO1342900.1 Cna B-type domain-containing protein [Enterococcus sp. 665A]